MIDGLSPALGAVIPLTLLFSSCSKQLGPVEAGIKFKDDAVQTVASGLLSGKRAIVAVSDGISNDPYLADYGDSLDKKIEIISEEDNWNIKKLFLMSKLYDLHYHTTGDFYQNFTDNDQKSLMDLVAHNFLPFS